jgi:drug/metabolite transporter (DMT)-like permease
LENNNLRGILFVLIGMTVSSIQDTLVKLFSDDLSIFQIQFFRSTIGIIWIILFQAAIRQPIILTTTYPGLSILRGALFFFAYSTFYFAQSKMPIATATVLFLVSPFFITILSILFFKSQVGYRRWLTMLVGFGGVVLICQPVAGEFSFYYLLPVLVALAYAIIVNITKMTSDKDTLYQQVLYMYFITALLSGLMGLLFGDGRLNTVEYSEFAFVTRAWVFTDINTAISLVGIAVVGASALLLLLGAYRVADPAVISPYEYTLLLWMILWGYIFWREVPSLYDLIGMSLIVGAGLYIYYREQIRNKDIKSDSILR